MNYCPHCGTRLEVTGRFCVSCGGTLTAALTPVEAPTAIPAARTPVAAPPPTPTAAVTPTATAPAAATAIPVAAATDVSPAAPTPALDARGPHATGPCGPPFGSTGNGPSAIAPAEVWAVAGLLAAAAVFLLWLTIKLIHAEAPALSAGSFVRPFAVLGIVLGAIIGSFALGLAAVAWRLLRGDKVGRALAWLLCGAVLLSELATSARRSTPDNLTIAACIGIAVLLALPRSQRFFRQLDSRPVGVVTAAAVIAYFAWDFVILGCALLPLATYSHKDATVGALMIVCGGALVAVNRQLSAGRNWARIAVSLLLTGCAVLVLVAEGRDVTSLALAALAGGGVLTLWSSEASRAYFANGELVRPPAPRWTRAQVGTAFAGVVALVVVLVTGFAGRSGQSLAADTPTYTPPPSNYAASTPTPAATGPDVTDSYEDSWTFTENTPGNQTANLTLDIGNAAPYQAGTTNGRDTLGSACTGDPSNDLAVPFRITMINNGSAADSIGMQLKGIGEGSIPDISGPGLEVEANFSDGPTCVGDGSDTSTVFGTQSTGASSGSAVTTYGFFVITGGQSVANTDTQQILDDAKLTVLNHPSVDSNDDTATITDANGPGLVSNVDGGWTLDLAGDTPAGMSG